MAPRFCFERAIAWFRTERAMRGETGHRRIALLLWRWWAPSARDLCGAGRSAGAASKSACATWLAVLSFNAVPSNFERVHKGCHAAQQADLRAGHIVPLHRNLEHAVAEVACDVEHLHVEAEAIQFLPCEDFARGRRFEQLKPALRTVKAQTRLEPHQDVEDAAHILAEGRLVDSYQRAVQRTRSECHLGMLALRGAPQLLEFFDGRREIRVGEERPFALGLEHP